MPTQTPARGGWLPTGVSYHGYPVYVSGLDGTMAYELDFERLVSLPEEVEESIADILLLDETMRALDLEVCAAIRKRSN